MKTDIDKVLQENEREVLKTVWRHGPIARVDIIERTGLGRASVTRITQSLMDKGLVEDYVLRDGQRGQPSRPVSLRPQGAYACGVYFSNTYMDVGLIDFAGQPIAIKRVLFNEATPDLLAKSAQSALLELVANADIDLKSVVGAGFALPGDFDALGGFSPNPYFPALTGLDLAYEFGQVMPVKVYVENDGAAAAVGERVHGLGRTRQSFLFFHIGHGVGGGLIINGSLFRGRHGNAGLLGGLYPMDLPRPSGLDLLNTLSASGLAVKDFNDLERINPDLPVLQEWIDRAAKQLRSALEVGARMFDPDAVILGGRMPPEIMNRLFDAIDISAAFESSSLPLPEVLVSEIGPNAGVIGAASICVFRRFFDQ